MGRGVLPDAASWAALVLLAVVAGLLGLRVVPTAPWWLRTVVGLGAALLALAVWFAGEAEFGQDRLAVVVGIAGLAGFLLAGVVALVRRGPDPRDHGVHVPSPRTPQPTHRSRRKGAHAR